MQTDLETLADLVARMRAAQERFSRDRSRESFDASYSLQRQVDLALANVWDGRSPLADAQGDLFVRPKQTTDVDQLL